MSAGASLIIPCYDEAARLDDEAVLSLVDGSALDLVLVDDGSRDATADRLRALVAARPTRIDALFLPANVGKGEAVRAGMNAAIAAGATIVGFADADFSTPPREIVRLLGVLQTARREPGAAVSVVMGSRVARLGARVERSPIRHGLGRAFATLAALALDAQVYDTQCGAKWFVADEAVRAALASALQTRWAFDLELLLRLVGRLDGPAPTIPLGAILEVPIESWTDRRGSKLDLRGMSQALAEVLGLLARARLSGVRTPESTTETRSESPVGRPDDV